MVSEFLSVCDEIAVFLCYETSKGFGVDKVHDAAGGYEFGWIHYSSRFVCWDYPFLRFLLEQTLARCIQFFCKVINVIGL